MTVEEIEKQIDSGKTLFVGTCLKCIKVNKKTLDKWRASGVALFKDDKDGRGFYIARGRSYDYVLESACKVEFI